MKTKLKVLAASILCTCAGLSFAETIIGNDLNSSVGANSAINALYSGNQGTNGGGDQSLQFGDQLIASDTSDINILVGGLGIDVIIGNEAKDIIIGGTEDFNPLNRDRAFGNAGEDIFIWAPGDGSDYFDGGSDNDVLIMSLIGEIRDDTGNSVGAPFFSVNPPSKAGSQDYDGIFINEANSLPVVNVAGGPGYCSIVDQSAAGMEELGIDHLVRFSLRGVKDAFLETTVDPSVDPTTVDNGLRVAVHLKNTEFVVCANRDGSGVDYFDLRQTPAAKVTKAELPETAQTLINDSLSLLFLSL